MTVGRIKWFNRYQSYGYITLFDGTEVYFHATGLKHGRAIDFIEAGTSVTFDIIHTRTGMEAQNIDVLY